MRVNKKYYDIDWECVSSQFPRCRGRNKLKYAIRKFIGKVKARPKIYGHKFKEFIND